MRKYNLFWKVFAGVLWEWVLIPLFFFLLLPDGKNYKFLFPPDNFSYLFAFLFFLPAFFLTIFSCFHLHRRGKGTIIPQNPPLELVCDGLYCYCRNPMYLGYSYLFASFAFFFKNIFFLFISIGVIIFILFYAKFYEEKVLVKRFGEKYIEYRSKTPFIVPFSKNVFRKDLFSLLFVFSDILFLFLLFYFLRVIFLISFK